MSWTLRYLNFSGEQPRGWAHKCVRHVDVRNNTIRVSYWSILISTAQLSYAVSLYVVIDFVAYLFGLGFLIIRKTNYVEITPF